MKELVNQSRAASAKRNTIHSSALEEVEQEREVEFQVEEVRQVQKPKPYTALTFPGLHPAVALFAKTGKLSGRKGYEQAFAALAGTNIGRKYNVCPTTSRLFVSTEFMRTIEIEKCRPPNDNFLVSSILFLSHLAHSL